MLRAYFDDNGTHGDSEVVAIGGLIGAEAQWAPFEAAWAAKLKQPLPGKSPLKRFHMAPCANGEGEFVGWSDAERNAVIHDFRQIILDSNLVGYAGAALIADWDRLIKDAARIYLGDAEFFCTSNCFIHTLTMAESHFQDPDVAFVFDDRPEREGQSRYIHEIYKKAAESWSGAARPFSISFMCSERTLPLQGADMIAWHSYQEARDHLQLGAHGRHFAHFKRLIESGRFFGQIADSAAIEKIAAQTSSAIIQATKQGLI